MRRPRILVVYASGRAARTLSYQLGWPRAFTADARYQTVLLDIADRRSRAAASVRLPRVDAVVLLHSVFSNERALGRRLTARFAALSAPKAWFIGNEYKLMPEKMAFAEESSVGLLVSQLTLEPPLALYRERLGCHVVGIPNTGLDPSIFRQGPPLPERSIDIGYRSYDLPWYVGHRDRSLLADMALNSPVAAGLRLDISLAQEDRFDELAWAAFLGRCRAQLGCEAGTDYFELTDATRNAVNSVLDEAPGTSFAEIRRLFFDQYKHPVSGRTVSSRVIEAAGTGTVQLLLEGEYGGYFQPGIHYVPLRKDASNIDEALGILSDETACRRMATSAREVALAELTFPKLIDRFHDALSPLL